MDKSAMYMTSTLIIAITCLISSIHSRSSAVSSYQHLNGITMRADSSIQNKDESVARPIQHNEQTMSDGITNKNQNENENKNENDNSSGIWKDLSLIYRIYQQCANENLSICLKIKLLTGLEKVLQNSKALRVIDGIQFVSSNDDDDEISELNDANQTNQQLPSESDVKANLPRSIEAKDQVLNSMIFKKLANFLRQRTLQIKLPDVRSMEHLYTNTFESRGKKKDKKGGGAYIMIPLLLGGTFVPIAYGALAMLAGKALIVSKLALVLASIIGIKKLLSSGGGGKEQHEVVVSSGGHSGWGRDIDLAYNGWKPAKENGQIA